MLPKSRAEGPEDGWGASALSPLLPQEPALWLPGNKGGYQVP